MTNDNASPAGDRTSPVYVVSGGTGGSGEMLVHTALAQFAGCRMPVVLVPRVRTQSQLEEVLSQAKADGGTVVHTLVDPRLRDTLTQLGAARGVPTIDLLGALLMHLSRTLGRAPVGQPGLYRQLNEPYFKRVAAINFAMRHDDGMKPEDLHEAEIVLLGVSRIGKTPLAMYLAVLGWKVANVPIIAGHELPAELHRIERRRVIGLTIEPDSLLIHRRSRQRQMKGSLPTEYTDPSAMYEELDCAARVFRQYAFAVVDVTHRPIETTADEIITLIGAG